MAATEDAICLHDSSERAITGENLSWVVGEAVSEVLCENVVQALENAAVVSTSDDSISTDDVSIELRAVPSY